jgi:hypothetical protein|nr:MAG TPA: hypothetical protein [Caudoviricetes sp.]
MNNLYYGAWEEFRFIANDFLDSVKEDIEYTLDGKSTGDVKVEVVKDTKLIKFTINAIRFEYDRRLVIEDHFMTVLRNNPYPLYMMVNLFHQMYRDNTFKAIDEDKRSCIARMAEGFLYLRGWFDDPEIEQIENADWERETRIRNRENDEFWKEYYEANPNDI